MYIALASVLHSRLGLSRRLVQIPTSTGRNTPFAGWARGLSQPVTLLINLWIACITRVGGISARKPRPNLGVHDLKQRPHIRQARCDDSNGGLDTCPHACWDFIICLSVISKFSYMWLERELCVQVISSPLVESSIRTTRRMISKIKVLPYVREMLSI